MHVHHHLFRYDSYATPAILSSQISSTFFILFPSTAFLHSFPPIFAYSLKLIVAEWNLIITSRAVKLGSDRLFHQY